MPKYNFAERLMVQARKEDKVELFFKEIWRLNDWLNKNSELKRDIDSTEIEGSRKWSILKESIRPELDGEVLRQFFVIDESTPFEYTPSNLSHDFINNYYKDHGVSLGQVYSVNELDDKTLIELQKTFSDLLKYDVVFENIIDKDLIGGVKVIVGDHIWDGTYKAKVDRLKRNLKAVNEEYDKDTVASSVLNNINSYTKTQVIQRSYEKMGVVQSVSDGIVNITGLNNAMAGELLNIDDHMAMVMDLKEHEVAAILLENTTEVSKGSNAFLTKKVMEVPVGDNLLGRVVDALGNPIDGKGVIHNDGFRPIEMEAPGIIDRESVNEPLETGIKMIDSMIPIGKGQRELIIGDRQTGKTAIAIDTIINQRGKNVKCIYVAIGQKNSTVAQIIEKLESNKALSYTTIVVASASDSPALQYIAPYSGTTMGEYWMNNGEDVLIIYDDLSKHAIAYRTISLLLRRPPGREAYPGDIFYLHSRLLERSGKLCKERGNGSLTALPIIETQAGDISAYIPTNVISITDGQIFLQTDLFNSGIRPAIDYGLSVSRVGGSAQYKAIRKVASSLKLELSQYQEVLSFSKFGSDLDTSTRNIISHGQHLTELLKQPQYQPMSMEDMCVLLFANSKGVIDQVPIDRMREFGKGLLQEMHNSHLELIHSIRDKKEIELTTADNMDVAIKEYLKQFKEGY